MSQTSGTVATLELRNIIQRIEALEQQKLMLGHDIKDILAEAKSRGFDTKAIRRVITLRKIEAKERDALESTVRFYLDVAEGKVEATSSAD